MLERGIRLDLLTGVDERESEVSRSRQFDGREIELIDGLPD
jgi:hypothetical protein